eukprot:Pgem_evm1s13794
MCKVNGSIVIPTINVNTVTPSYSPSLQCIGNGSTTRHNARCFTCNINNDKLQFDSISYFEKEFEILTNLRTKYFGKINNANNSKFSLIMANNNNKDNKKRRNSNVELNSHNNNNASINECDGKRRRRSSSSCLEQSIQYKADQNGIHDIFIEFETHVIVVKPVLNNNNNLVCDLIRLSGISNKQTHVVYFHLSSSTSLSKTNNVFVKNKMVSLYKMIDQLTDYNDDNNKYQLYTYD